MPCFQIQFVYPKSEKRIDAMNERLLRILARQYFAKIQEIPSADPGYLLYETTLCDMEVADFIHDLPRPFYIQRIYCASLEFLLYSNWKLDPTFRPPLIRGPILKTIFWNAKQMERWTPIPPA